MKPADHPEFFLRPAPGRTGDPDSGRDSGLRLDARGGFWHAGERVERRSMVQALFRWLRRHPHNGRYILENGYDWAYLQVDDTPLFVVGLSEERLPRPPAAGPALESPTRRGGPRLRLSDGSEEPLLPRPLWIGPEEALYTRVRGPAALEARFLPSAQAALGPWLVQEAGAYGLRVGELFQPVEVAAGGPPPSPALQGSPRLKRPELAPGSGVRTPDPE